MRIRIPTTPSRRPENVVRIVRPQVARAMATLQHHYTRRHDVSAPYRAQARNWAQEVKRIDASSGYSSCLAATRTRAGV